MPPSIDRFESLSDSLISYIFCQLTPSARSLRRCEVVCKRWNRISKLVNTLDFSDISVDDEPIIWQYLFSNSHIRSLIFNPLTAYREKSVNSWLQQVSSTLESLAIRTPNFAYVLCCQNLVVLRLYRCRIRGFTHGLPCLRTLLIELVRVSNKDLGAFLMLCPQLQYLDLHPIGNTCVNISCPKLKTLVVYMTGAKITISNSACLEHLIVDSLSKIVFKSPKPRLETAILLIASEKTLECIQDMSIGRLIVHPAKCCKLLKMPELFKHITTVEELEMTALFFQTLEDEVGIRVGDADKCILHLKEIEIRFNVMDKVSIKKLDSFLSSLSLCCSKLEKLFIYFKTEGKGVLNDLLQLQQSNRDVRIMCDEQDASLFDSIEEFNHQLPDHLFNLD